VASKHDVVIHKQAAGVLHIDKVPKIEADHAGIAAQAMVLFECSVQALVLDT
jgi:hypothetical protein